MKNNKILAHFLHLLLCISFANGQIESESISELTTLNGITIRDAQITKIEPDGITFRNEYGYRKVKFDNLNQEWRSRYKYDREKAVAFEADQKFKRDQFQKQSTQRAALHEMEKKQEKASVSSEVVRKDYTDDVFEDKSILLRVEENYLQRFIFDICLGWKGESKNRKASSQMQVVFYDETGKNMDLFFRAAEDINEAFGYQKVIPQLSAIKDSKDGSFLIYYGPKIKGKAILRKAGHRSPGNSRWDSWSWWDDSKGMSKATIAMYSDDIDGLKLSFDVRKAILCSLGFPGYSSNYPASNIGGSGIFDSFERRFSDNAPAPDREGKIITNFDKAVIQFCDRFLSTDSSRGDIVNQIKKNWPLFIQEYVNAK